MYRRTNPEDIVLEETKVWECVSDHCNGWIRDNFTSDENHKCPLCGSDMKAGSKMLQGINNPRKN